ncbi:MAG: FAD-binding oxidoreductase [Pseudomonadota bacterium]
MSPVSRSKADSTLNAIREAVGPEGVIDDPEVRAPLLVDHRALYHGDAALVVRPANTAEAARVVALCADAGIAIVPQGGNTGYCGGATPDASGTQVLLNLSRMNAVRSVDPVNYSMELEAGVVLATAQQAAADASLLFPLSLGSEGSCQVGGNLASNAGGTAVLRYGNVRDMVMGLEVVLPDGRVWNGLRQLRKDNAGYDLKQLFVGSEGTLGIITAAVLKLFPRPAASATAFVAVPTPQAACELLARARALSGDAVTSFEYLPALALDLVVQNIDDTRMPLDARAAHYALIELSTASDAEAVGELVQRLLASAMEAGEVEDGVVAQSGQQADALWRLRENVPAAQRAVGNSLKHDISVPVSRIAGFLEESSDAVRAIVPDVRLCTYGHIGDGNLHFNLLPPEGESLERFIASHGEALSDAVYDLVQRYQGSVCAEHGVGQLKRDLLATHADPVALELMRSVKKAIDPQGIMNPGKVL